MAYKGILFSQIVFTPSTVMVCQKMTHRYWNLLLWARILISNSFQYSSVSILVENCVPFCVLNSLIYFWGICCYIDFGWIEWLINILLMIIFCLNNFLLPHKLLLIFCLTQIWPYHFSALSKFFHRKEVEHSNNFYGFFQLANC